MNPFNARGYPSQQAKHPNNINTLNGATTLDRNEQDCHTEASEIEPLFSNVDDIKLYESNNNQTAQVLKIPIDSLCEICCSKQLTYWKKRFKSYCFPNFCDCIVSKFVIINTFKN